MITFEKTLPLIGPILAKSHLFGSNFTGFSTGLNLWNFLPKFPPRASSLEIANLLVDGSGNGMPQWTFFTPDLDGALVALQFASFGIGRQIRVP